MSENTSKVFTNEFAKLNFEHELFSVPVNFEDTLLESQFRSANTNAKESTQTSSCNIQSVECITLTTDTNDMNKVKLNAATANINPNIVNKAIKKDGPKGNENVPFLSWKRTINGRRTIWWDPSSNMTRADHNVKYGTDILRGKR